MGTSTGAEPRTQTRRTEQDRTAERRPRVLADDGGIASRLERRTGDRRGACGQPSAASDLDTRALCHDLRQPLAAASMLAQLLGRETALPGAGQERLALLQGELGRLAAMVTAHLEAPRTELVDLAVLARDVLRPCAAGPAGQPDLVEEQAALVLGDRVQLTRALANLVANARAAAGRSGRVRITVGQQGEQARLVVEDSGGADVSSGPGHGLGLMIVDTVVTRHGGAVQCGQSDLGGLRLTVLLPGLGSWHPGDRA